jgi:intein/homing endonuclease
MRTLSYSTVSESLAYQLPLLLSKLGTVPRVYKQDRLKPSIYKGREIKYKGPVWTVCTNDEKIISVINDDKALQIRSREVHKYKKIGGSFFYKIKSILEIDLLEDIYNLEVEDDHSYVANNVIVKNCTYSHVNELFENIIIEDKMMCDFI